MRLLTLRTTAAAAVLPLAMASLAACGSDGSDTAADPQSPSSTTTSSSPTDSATPDPASHEGKSVDKAEFLTMIKASAKTITTADFHMAMDFSGQQIFAKGAIDMTGSTPAMQMTMDLTGMGTPTEMRLVGGAMYVAAPGMAGKFIKLDLNDKNSPLAGYGDTLGSVDPQSMIDQMSVDAFQKVTYIGTESVGGQQLKHYRVVLDTAAALKMFQGMPSTASIPKAMTYDLWLDDQNRMNKFAMLLPKVMKVTATYTDFGSDLHITAPDPSDVEAMPSAGATG